MLRLKGQTESGEWEEFDIDDLNAVHARYENDDSKFGLWVNKRKPNSLNGWMAIFVVSATIQPAESLEFAALREQVKVLREALDGLLFLFAAKGESSLDTFERIGDAFYRDTLMLRPGKSEPFECDYEGRDEERRAAFDAWIEKRKESAAIVLNQTKPKDGE